MRGERRGMRDGRLKSTDSIHGLICVFPFISGLFATNHFFLDQLNNPIASRNHEKISFHAAIYLSDFLLIRIASLHWASFSATEIKRNPYRFPRPMYLARSSQLARHTFAGSFRFPTLLCWLTDNKPLDCGHDPRMEQVAY